VKADAPGSRLGGVGLALYNTFYWPYLLASCVLLFFPALALYALTFWDPRRRVLHAYTSLWGAHYLAWAPFAGVRLEGRERGLAAGPCVYVSNHQSMVDILAAFATRLPYLWVSKAENFLVPFLGWNMWLSGYIPLKRGNIASIRRMLRRCESRIRSGASLFVFPEGTRSPDGELKSFYRGAFWVAARNRVPIVPVVIEGTARVLPKRRFRIVPQQVSVRILPPVDPADFAWNDRKLRDHVHEVMRLTLADMARSASEPRVLESEPRPAEIMK
jgi:1-acyl-sn-glycerol-3-phosphate acyltransferase